MSSISYQQLALDWSPDNRSNRQFNLIAVIVVLVLMLAAVVVSSITVPEQKRETRNVVPERIAKFIIEKKKPEPKIVKPKPKPKPKLKPKPEVKKPAKEKSKKPLTKIQKKAREKAAESGLLALSNELSDLMDTSDVSSMVGGNVKKGAASPAASQNKAILMAGASKGSSGVDAEQYTTTLAKTQLSQREITQVKQSLIATDVKSSATASSKGKPRAAGVRAEEDITIVFDQNKSKLYSIYNRARRSNPNLKGKIILEITIAPSGKVVNISMVSSGLNDPKLESRLIKRIKQFDFGAQKVEQIVVTYPIEFLPS